MSLSINAQDFEPGSKSFLRLKVAKMLDSSELYIPLHVIRGVSDGPVLGLLASVHGTEYYQNRIIRRIVNETSADEVNGTILAVPVANSLRSPTYPGTPPIPLKRPWTSRT